MKHTDMTALFKTILSHVEPPDGDPEAPLQFQISALDYSSYTVEWGLVEFVMVF